MYAETMLQDIQGHDLLSPGKRTVRHVHADRVLALAVISVALVAAMLIAMVPGFADVRVDGQAVPAPTPAPIVVQSAR